MKVVEDADKGERYLCNRNCDFIQGAMNLSRPDTLMIDYMRSAMAGLAFLDAPPQRMLFIGMGIVGPCPVTICRGIRMPGWTSLKFLILTWSLWPGSGFCITPARNSREFPLEKCGLKKTEYLPVQATN